ncbi:hypothetical protein CO612_01285 [Lysobacteraceae bacterium NML71-0210]|nr:hypothetical protein CO612_01285 [Xanthomonadaceae bacterium NML71-0210]
MAFYLNGNFISQKIWGCFVSNNDDCFENVFGVMVEEKDNFWVVDDSTLEISRGLGLGAVVSAAVFSCLATYFYCRD